MKKTQQKDARKNIRRERISYFSIMLIALLAVAAYLGIIFCSAALKNNGDRFYKQLQFRDIEITSTMLLSEEDIEALRSTEGVEDVEGIYTATASLNYAQGTEDVQVVSLSDRINTVELIDGRLPENERECALEQSIAEKLSLSAGDRISILDEKGETLSFLTQKDYLITATVTHPDHIAHSAYVPARGYVMVPKESFDTETLEGCFMSAIIRVAGTEELSLFSKDYQNILQTVKDRLEPLNEELAQGRETTIRNKMQEKIDEGQVKLEEGKQKLEDARTQLDENQKKLEDAKKELKKARKQLKDGKKQLEDGQAELDAASARLADAKAQLDEGKSQLDAGEAQLNEAKTKADVAKAQLDEGKNELDKAKKKLDKANAQLVSSYNEAEDKKAEVRNILKEAVKEVVGKKKARKINWASPAKITDAGSDHLDIGQFAILTDYSVDLTVSLDTRVRSVAKDILKIIGEEDQYDKVIETIENNAGFQQIDAAYNTVIEQLNQWNAGQKEYRKGLAAYKEKEKEYQAYLAEYQAGLAKYQEGLAEFNEKKAEYEQGLAEYNSGMAQYQEGLATLEEKQAEYDKGRKEYKSGRKELKEGLAKLEEGEQEYQDGVAEYEEKVIELEDAKKQLDELSNCYFVMLDTNGNGGFAHISGSAKNIGNIALTFALLFVIVGALVIYVTLGRIIGEHRNLVGAQKALGFWNNEILRKYLIFGVSSTLIGMLLGTAIGYFVIQRICIGAYGTFYILENMTSAFRLLPFLIVFVAGILLSALAVWWACRSLLKQSAKELMQYELPKAKKKAGRVSKGRSSSLYSRLIFRNIISDWRRVLITIISVAGCCTLLVIGFMIQDSVNGAISIQFNQIIRYDHSAGFNSEVNPDAETEIRDTLKKENISGLSLLSKEYAFDGNGETSLVTVVSGNLDEIRQYFALQPSEGLETQEWSENGLLIPRKYAEQFHLKVGDAMTIYDTDMSPREIPISGIYQNYLGQNVFLSRQAYESAFAEEPANNEIWFNSAFSKEELTQLLKPIKGFNYLKEKSEQKEPYAALTNVLVITTLVLIVAAGLLAYFVLLNLINMYLNKKKRELTVMRINGFTTAEVIRYVALESVVTTVAGILLGLLIGTILGNLILGILEMYSASFVHGIIAHALLLSAGITIVFSAAINALALRKVKNLKLTDI